MSEPMSFFHLGLVDLKVAADKNQQRLTVILPGKNGGFHGLFRAHAQYLAQRFNGAGAGSVDFFDGLFPPPTGGRVQEATSILAL